MCSAKRKKKSKASPTRPKYLGPTGNQFAYELNPYGRRRFFQRLFPCGISDAALEAAVRDPNTKWVDRVDPHPSGVRRQRFVFLNTSDGGRARVRVVFMVHPPTPPSSQETLEVLNVMIEARS